MNYFSTWASPSCLKDFPQQFLIKSPRQIAASASVCQLILIIYLVLNEVGEIIFMFIQCTLIK